MKKKIFIINALVLVSSYNLLASTGSANDEILFTLVIIAFLSLLAGIISGVNYLKNNGKKLIYNSKSFLKKIIISLKEYLNKLKSEYLKLSYLKH